MRKFNIFLGLLIHCGTATSIISDWYATCNAKGVEPCEWMCGPFQTLRALGASMWPNSVLQAKQTSRGIPSCLVNCMRRLLIHVIKFPFLRDGVRQISFQTPTFAPGCNDCSFTVNMRHSLFDGKMSKVLLPSHYRPASQLCNSYRGPQPDLPIAERSLWQTGRGVAQSARCRFIIRLNTKHNST